MNKDTHSSPLLRVFLCHASVDKPSVCNLYNRLLVCGIEPWFDEEKLVGGQDWELEIRRAVRASHIVIVCLSQASVYKAGFVQKEIRYALDVADEQPEGNIFLIPLRLELCEVPDRLRRWQWIDLYEPNGYSRLMKAIYRRARELGIPIQSNEGVSFMGLSNIGLPGAELIYGSEQVELELTKAASNAKEFILATGGEARSERYLETITLKVLNESVSYTRIVFGDHIHHPLCTQLRKLLGHQQVRIAHALNEKSGTALITEDVVIFTTIPSMNPPAFDTVVKVQNPMVSKEYRNRSEEILSRSIVLKSAKQVRALCRECRAKSKIS